MLRMWRQISERAESLRSGSIFVSTTHVLCSSLYEVVEKMNCIMAWGSCTVYIHVSSFYNVRTRFPDEIHDRNAERWENGPVECSDRIERLSTSLISI